LGTPGNVADFALPFITDELAPPRKKKNKEQCWGIEEMENHKKLSPIFLIA
jgi:hypothetical protein